MRIITVINATSNHDAWIEEIATGRSDPQVCNDQGLNELYMMQEAAGYIHMANVELDKRHDTGLIIAACHYRLHAIARNSLLQINLKLAELIVKLEHDAPFVRADEEGFCSAACPYARWWCGRIRCAKTDNFMSDGCEAVARCPHV